MIAYDINWVEYGIITGSFWGIFAILFYVPYPLKWGNHFDYVRSVFILIFQFVFNFIGGFIGWYFMSLFLSRYSQGHFSYPEMIVLSLSTIAISGKLSDVIYLLPGALKDAMNRVIRK